MISPVPDGGSVRFLDDGTTILGCDAVSLNTFGFVQAACATSYGKPGSHENRSGVFGRRPLRQLAIIDARPNGAAAMLSNSDRVRGRPQRNWVSGCSQSWAE